MDTIVDTLTRGFRQLIERADGPLHFRLVVMPIMASIFAVLGDWRDAREGRPAPLGAFFRDSVERQRLLRMAVKDVWRVFAMAVLMDTIYQLWVFKWLYPVQLLIVAFACAVVPYVLVRGPITRIVRLLIHRRSGPEVTP